VRLFHAGRGHRHRGLSIALTLLAGALVWAALVLPDELSLLTPSTFFRIPIEALVVIALAVVLPERARRVTAVVFGLLLGLVLVVKVTNIGFELVLDRSFDPAVDWAFLGPGVGVVRETEGLGWAVAAVVGAAVGTVAALTLLPLATLRLTRLAAGHRRPSLIAVTALGLVWVLAAVTGLQLSPGGRVASASAAERVYSDVRQLRADIRDRVVFTAQANNDEFADVPADRLLTGLRGKDVLVVFVESYGRVAIQDPALSPEVNRVLEAGTSRLDALGFSARSGFLTSPTFGAGSWLAHATLQSGLWLDNQQRYDQLLAGDRMTLSSAFERAGWRTVFALPAVKKAWPEGANFYGYDGLVDFGALQYDGPKFGWSPVPDQYLLSRFEQLELTERDREPVMAEVDLSSSHHPWAPLPRMVPWSSQGDGSVYRGMQKEGPTSDEVFEDPEDVRAQYASSVAYSLEALISWVGTYADDDLVMVVLGDHQPHTYVTGPDPDHDVPVSILAHDPDVLRRVSGWGWDAGLRPGPDAPVWRMDSFRDRFLTTFGPG
jgi:hypothetical protein